MATFQTQNRKFLLHLLWCLLFVFLFSFLSHSVNLDPYVSKSKETSRLPAEDSVFLTDLTLDMLLVTKLSPTTDVRRSSGVLLASSTFHSHFSKGPALQAVALIAGTTHSQFSLLLLICRTKPPNKNYWPHPDLSASSPFSHQFCFYSCVSSLPFSLHAE